jgi:hypothetical protein
MTGKGLRKCHRQRWKGSKTTCIRISCVHVGTSSDTAHPTYLTVSTEGMMILRKCASGGMGEVSMEEDQGCHL